MSTMFNDTMDTAKSTIESAKDGTQHAVSSARSTLLDGIHAVNGVVSILRGLEFADALGWIGLARRRGPLGSIALFGAGVALGTGIGMLFAPKSGAETRRALFGGLEKETKEIEHKAENLAGKAKDAVVNAEHKAEDYAGKAKDAVVNAERKMEDYVGKAKDSVVNVERKVENKVGQRVEMAKDAVKDAADQAKSLMTPPDSYRPGDDKGANGTGNHRSTLRHA